MTNALSVDVEDYFHPTEMAAGVTPEQWDALPPRLEEPVDRLLETLASRGVRATFFVLGWAAQHHPAMVRRIQEAGHEVGCHSFWHRLVYHLTREEFRQDTKDAVAAIEDACGVRARLYRAPSYSITKASMWALEILAELGFTHDSSIYPVKHDRYGIEGFPRGACRLNTPAGEILEVPPATARLGRGRIAPAGGGGYLRLLPYRYTAAGLRSMNLDDGLAGCVYVHPWELDPEQPRVGRGWIARWRTYAGLKGMEQKLRRLLDDFEFAPIGAVFPAAPAASRDSR
jgi:polysaccharide deacetylase family protein (PEP-CTERM system associated)